MDSLQRWKEQLENAVAAGALCLWPQSAHSLNVTVALNLKYSQNPPRFPSQSERGCSKDEKLIELSVFKSFTSETPAI